ncbi:hypothetical protein GBAR_LOCUS5310, partial [Geodia barretti]
TQKLYRSPFFSQPAAPTLRLSPILAKFLSWSCNGLASHVGETDTLSTTELDLQRPHRLTDSSTRRLNDSRLIDPST